MYTVRLVMINSFAIFHTTKLIKISIKLIYSLNYL
nr:MAG TPA: hypothetical protein [Caudoviricetes sp.]